MKVLLVINLLLVTFTRLSDSAVIGDIKEESLYYKNQIKILYQLLSAECPNKLKYKRDVSSATSISSLELRVQKIHYNMLLKELSECKNRKLKPSVILTPTTPCLSATNLTESWRMDHDGKDLRGGGPNAHSSSGRACDFRKSLQWFRFTGAAGKNNKS